MLALGRLVALPTWLFATEVFATILGLFLFGSFRYQIHKNALTYGMLLVIVATFAGLARRSGMSRSPNGLVVTGRKIICCRSTGSTI